MQLLRDNLTLWTSSDGAEGESAAEPAKDEKAEEPAPAEAEAPKPAATEEAAPAAAPAS
jgi:14-3-3 protein epsilon